jgi:hypothetical protein
MAFRMPETVACRSGWVSDSGEAPRLLGELLKRQGEDGSRVRDLGS